MLTKQAAELARLRAQNRQLQSALAVKDQNAQPANADTDAEAQPQGTIAKMNDAKLLALGLLMFVDEHPGSLPVSTDQMSNYWNHADVKFSGTNQFELVTQDSPDKIAKSSETIVFREKDPWFGSGKWHKAYAFADGHAELITAPPEGFQAWEQQHISPSKPANP